MLSRVLLLSLFAATPALAAPEAVVWTAAPSFDEVAAAYPADAKAKGLSGEAVLDCALNSQGRVARCSTVSESPAGAGFAQAARGLIDRFQGPTERAGGKTIAGVHTNLAFKFTPDLLGEKTVTHPEWVATPPASAFQAVFPDAASKAGVLNARAVMSCAVTAQAGLTDCRSLSEDPPGYGVGQATLPLASGFRLNAWGADGRPVVGGVVRVPLRYKMEQAPAPKP
jgi:TonB family protein